MSEPPRAPAAGKAASDDARAKEPVSAPLAPEDFYYDKGLLVFTAAYHLKRGYCCNSGCRHCPFR